MLSTLLSITEKSGNISVFTLPFLYNKRESSSEKQDNTSNQSREPYTLVSLGGTHDEEMGHIETHLALSSPLLILSQNKKQSNSLEKYLRNEGYSTSIYKDQ